MTTTDSSGERSAVHFIISAPRSGSTWLMHALSQHPRVFATENRLFGEYATILPDPEGNPLPRITFDKYARAMSQHFNFQALDMNRAQFLRSFQRAYLNFLTRYSMRHSNKDVMLDKVTPYEGTIDTVLAGIESFYPDSKLVYLLRDGRDVATSGAFDWLEKDAQGTQRYAFFVEGRSKAPLQRFFDDDLISKWAGNWSEINQRLSQVDVATTTVRYEDMTRDQASELQRLFAALGIDCDPQTAHQLAESSTFEKMTGRAVGVNEPLGKARKGIVGDWKNYFTRSDGAIFHEIAGRDLIEQRYESDEKWYEKLPQHLSLNPPGIK